MTTLPAYAGATRVTWARVLRSEWTKLRSLPSTAWSLLVALALIVGFGLLYAMFMVTRPPSGGVAQLDPSSITSSGVQLAQLAIGVLGVLLITGEYATGMVRASFAAVPRRLPILTGKAVALVASTLALCVPATFGTFFAGQSIMAKHHLDSSLSQPGVARAVLGGGLYLAAVGLLGLGLGAVLRNTAGSVAALFGVLFAPQLLLGFLPGHVADHVFRYLPSPAGLSVTFARPDPSDLSPWLGLGVFGLYIAVLLGIAGWRMRRRDA
jgi:ABC-type transport system involved in multi-copper enzyme maturation permease subunit